MLADRAVIVVAIIVIIVVAVVPTIIAIRDVPDRLFAGYRIPDTYRIVPGRIPDGRIPDSRIPDSRIVVSLHQAFYIKLVSAPRGPQCQTHICDNNK